MERQDAMCMKTKHVGVMKWEEAENTRGIAEQLLRPSAFAGWDGALFGF